MRAAPAASPARIVFLGAVAFLWLGTLLYRLVDLQVVRYEEFARRARQQQQRVLEVTPKRGVIYDRNRHELAVSVDVESLFAIPPEVRDPAASARLLAPVLGQDAAALEEKLRTSRSFVWVQRKLDAAAAARVKQLNLAGLYLQREHKRFYPKRELAAHVLGFVGLDENGLAGFEYSLEDVLRGKSQRLVISADGRRRWFERRTDARLEGDSVILTLDQTLQFIAEQELDTAITRTRAASGTILIQNPRTGEIFALANYPTFNPNSPAADPPATHVNRALSLVYEPGSTFKVVTIAAALEEERADPEEVIDCQRGSIVLAGHRIRDHKPFGALSLRQIIYESSDVGAIKVGLRVGEEKMDEHIRRWGFGRPTGIELPAESPGLLRPASSWSRISIGAISMGQEVGITPLQLSVAISAIANGGERIAPRLVASILRSDKEEKATPAPRERILRKEVAEELRTMLTGVVTQGTGRFAQPAGYSAAGKTGTAQKIDASGRYSRTDFIASFAGFAPVADPALTVVVVLDSPRGALYHGGEVAAPVFRSVVERSLAYLNVRHDLPIASPPAKVRLERAAYRDFDPGQLDSLWTGEPAAASSPGGSFLRDSRVGLLPPKSLRGETLQLPTGSVVVVSAGQAATVPDFTGQSLRTVGEQCSRLGLEPVLLGTGVAVTQRPPAGSRVPRGSRVWVEFRSALPRPPARPM
jgi:cell division protein FtsI (penicillin-binding protein 3)